MKRTEVYKLIDSEREYQAWVVNMGVMEALHVIRKLAAIAVRTMELYGAPARS